MRPKRVCSIRGCRRPHQALGWCWLHWRRHQRHGDPLHEPLSALVLTKKQIDAYLFRPATTLELAMEAGVSPVTMAKALVRAGVKLYRKPLRCGNSHLFVKGSYYLAANGKHRRCKRCAAAYQKWYREARKARVAA